MFCMTYDYNKNSGLFKFESRYTKFYLNRKIIFAQTDDHINFLIHFGYFAYNLKFTSSRTYYINPIIIFRFYKYDINK